MRIFRFSLILLLCLPGFLFTARAQDEEEELQEGWNTSLSIGLELTQLLQINPKQGAGQNNFGFGGAILADAVYKKDHILWESSGSWLVGLQKVGAGLVFVPNVSLPGGGERVPFQKSVDELRVGSKIGYSLDPNKKWFLTAGFTFFTNALTTYPGPESFPGNFLSNIVDTLTNTSFINPAFITLSLGLEYKPNDHWSFYYSPVGAKWIWVPDDQIAALGIHGNPVRGDRDPLTGLYTDFDNADNQFGSLFRAAYKQKFWEEKIEISSALLLYSNYLRNPQNIDVDWNNSLAFKIFKGLEIRFLFTVFYDDDVLVQITDYDAVGGVSGLGKRVNFTQQLLVSYSIAF